MTKKCKTCSKEFIGQDKEAAFCSRSCARTKHGMINSPEYKSWCSMKARCNNKNSAKYPEYGGKGIEICESWLVFENFINDMGARPFGTTLDRIDGNLGYSKNNCRWATPIEQQNNIKTNVRYNYFGKMLTPRQISIITGVEVHTLRQRLRIGWSMERAISQPVKKRPRNT